MADLKITELTEATTVDSTDIIPIVVEVSTVPITKYASVDTLFTDYLAQSTVNGRLTLESGVPISSADQAAKTTVYFTPYMGNKIGLYDGTYWKLHTFAELSLSLSGYTANKNYDIFVYDNAGTITLESVVWTNDTTRATALASQDGIYVKTGATNKRYVGTIRTTATTGQCEDSLTKRFVWNMHNRVERPLLVKEVTDTWTYDTAAWRQVNNSTANQIAVVVGLLEDPIQLQAVLSYKNTAAAATGYTAIGEDATNAYATGCIGMNNTAPLINISCPVWCTLRRPPASIGYHYYAWIEYGAANDVFYGDAGAPDRFQSGVNGVWKA